MKVKKETLIYLGKTSKSIGYIKDVIKNATAEEIVNSSSLFACVDEEYKDSIITYIEIGGNKYKIETIGYTFKDNLVYRVK